MTQVNETVKTELTAADYRKIARVVRTLITKNHDKNLEEFGLEEKDIYFTGESLNELIDAYLDLQERANTLEAEELAPITISR